MNYILPVAYVIVSYTFIFIMNYFNHFKDGMWILGALLPFVMGIVNLIVVLTAGRKWPRKTLLSCTLIIKYSLIPIYLFGGGMTIIFALLALVPMLGMALNGVIAVISLIYGYGILLGSAPYAIAYLIKSNRDGINSKCSVLLCGICQFIFSLDVLTIMVMSLKERHRAKTTIAVFAGMCIVILLMASYVFVSMAASI